MVEDPFRLITLNHKEYDIFILIRILVWRCWLIKEFHSDFIPHFHYKSCNFQPKHYKKKKLNNQTYLPSSSYQVTSLFGLRSLGISSWYYRKGFRTNLRLCGWLEIRNIKDCGLKQIIFLTWIWIGRSFSLLIVVVIRWYNQKIDVLSQVQKCRNNK